MPKFLQYDLDEERRTVTIRRDGHPERVTMSLGQTIEGTLTAEQAAALADRIGVFVGRYNREMAADSSLDPVTLAERVLRGMRARRRT